jgi:hypothetical protein
MSKLHNNRNWKRQENGSSKSFVSHLFYLPGKTLVVFVCVTVPITDTGLLV